MKSFILLAALSVVSIFASDEDYQLYNDSERVPRYFVKLGAYNELDLATKLEKSTKEFDTKIINMKRYYSVVSHEFTNIEEAKRYLLRVKKYYSDAYIISLYKNKEIRVPISNVLTSYDKGITFYKSRRYEDALASFDRALIDDENDLKSNLYYAKTLYKLGIYKEANSEFNKLLHLSLNENDKREVKSYLDAIESKTKRSFFKGSLSIGVGYDDNINLTTDDKTTRYGEYILTNDTDKKDSTYGIASLLVEHRYDGRLFDIVSSLNSYNEFAHSAKGNDFNFLDLQTGIQKRYKDVVLYLPIGVNISYLDSDEIGYNIYTSPSFRYFINENFITSLESTYLDNSSKYMDGKDYRMLGVNGGIIYRNKNLQSGFFGGYNQFDAKEDLRFDVDKDVLNTSIYSYYTFYKNYVGFNGSYAKEDFNKEDSALGYKREDKIFRYGLSFGRNINKNLATSLGFKHITNESNINVYSYDKNNYIFDIKYRF